MKVHWCDRWCCKVITNKKEQHSWNLQGIQLRGNIVSSPKNMTWGKSCIIWLTKNIYQYFKDFFHIIGHYDSQSSHNLVKTTLETILFCILLLYISNITFQINIYSLWWLLEREWTNTDETTRTFWSLGIHISLLIND